MRDIESLTNQVTLAEYETGRDLFNLLRERGIPAHKVAGMVYRAGFIDGKRTGKARAGREIGRLQDVVKELKQSPPEATAEDVPEMDSAMSAEPTTAQEEGSTENE